MMTSEGNNQGILMKLRVKQRGSYVSTQKVTGQFCAYLKDHRTLLYATGKVTGNYYLCPLCLYNLMIVLVAVLAVFLITIRSNDLTRGSTTRSRNDFMILSLY